MSLPIYDIRDELIRSLEETPRRIVEAPTGSGKSPQVPQMLRDSGLVGDGMRFSHFINCENPAI